MGSGVFVCRRLSRMTTTTRRRRRCCSGCLVGRRTSVALVLLVAVVVAVMVGCLPIGMPTARALSGQRQQRQRRPVVGTRTVPSQPAAAAAAAAIASPSNGCSGGGSITTIVAENVWRTVAFEHRRHMKELLEPGLVDPDHPLMRSVRKQFRQRQQQSDDETIGMTMLDPMHPVYNFLVEYYGLKGLKGPKRLSRWSPSIGLFFWTDDEDDIGERRDTKSSKPSPRQQHARRRIDTVEEYRRASRVFRDGEEATTVEPSISGRDERDETDRRIFLEGATPDDFGLTLFLQGAEWIDATNSDDGGVGVDQTNSCFGGRPGILYRPIRFYGVWGDDGTVHDDEAEETEMVHRKATSFAWYKSILESTLGNEAILHCYGLHEWAMQYQPEGAPPPPSGKYQSHLPLRVSRETINRTVERKGLRCTHVDALRFFAPGAGDLNFHGASLERRDQLALEQPGCVHAHMDLLKVALRIKPYCDPDLLREVLETALKARALDVGASPYDCSAYDRGSSSSNNSNSNNSADGSESGIRVRVVPVETPEGRALYKRLQSDLMAEAEPVRTDLLRNYEAFGALAFSRRQLDRAAADPTDERFARAEPGGKAWRHNLLDRSSAENDDDDETSQQP